MSILPVLQRLWENRLLRQRSGPTNSQLLEREIFSRGWYSRFREQEHPRDADGQFTESGGAVGVVEGLRNGGAMVGDTTAQVVPHPSGRGGYVAEIATPEGVGLSLIHI